MDLWFHFFAIVNSVAMNIQVQVFVSIHVFNFGGYTIRNENAGAYDNYIFHLLMLQKPFHVLLIFCISSLGKNYSSPLTTF